MYSYYDSYEDEILSNENDRITEQISKFKE